MQLTVKCYFSPAPHLDSYCFCLMMEGSGSCFMMEGFGSYLWEDPDRYSAKNAGSGSASNEKKYGSAPLVTTTLMFRRWMGGPVRPVQPGRLVRHGNIRTAERQRVEPESRRPALRSLSRPGLQCLCCPDLPAAACSVSLRFIFFMDWRGIFCLDDYR